MDVIQEIEQLFVSYPFAKDCLLIVLSVILGAFFTAIINNGAMKKQSKFNLQFEILKKELDKVVELSKSIESLEIVISFSKQEIEPFSLFWTQFREHTLKFHRFAPNYNYAFIPRSLDMVSPTPSGLPIIRPK